MKRLQTVEGQMNLDYSSPERSKLVTIEQFATLASIGVRTLERLDAAGQLPRRVPLHGADGKMLRMKRWSRRSVEEWIQRRGAAVNVAV